MKISRVDNISFKNSQNIQFPTKQRNYCVFDQNKVDFFVKQKDYAIPYLTNILSKSNDEKQLTETLYIIDKLIDNGVQNPQKLYPALSKLNSTTSPNVQTFLAGIYRKIQVPDAFGPLVKMLIQNSIQPHNPCQTFDPNEEIGGAILSYISDRWKN